MVIPYKEEIVPMNEADIKIIRNKLMINILVIALMLIGSVVFITFSIDQDSVIPIVMVALFSILMLVFFGYPMRKTVHDVRERMKKVATGSIESTRTHTSTSSSSNGSRTTSTSYYITLGGKERSVGKKVYNDLNRGTEVEFHIALHSEAILSYTVLSRDNEVTFNLFAQQTLNKKSIPIDNIKGIKRERLSSEESEFLRKLRSQHIWGSIIGVLVMSIFMAGFFLFIMFISILFFSLGEHPTAILIIAIIYGLWCTWRIVRYITKHTGPLGDDHAQQEKHVFKSVILDKEVVTFQLPSFGLVNKKELTKPGISGFIIQVGKQQIKLNETDFNSIEKDEPVLVHLLPCSQQLLKLIRINKNQVLFDALLPLEEKTGSRFRQ